MLRRSHDKEYEGETYADTSLDSKVDIQLVLELGHVDCSRVIGSGESSPIEIEN